MTGPLQPQIGDILLYSDSDNLLKHPIEIGAVQTDGIGDILNRDIFIIGILDEKKNLLNIIFFAGQRLDFFVVLHQFGAEQVKLPQSRVAVGDGSRIQRGQRPDYGDKLFHRFIVKGGRAVSDIAQIHQLQGAQALKPDPIIHPGIQHIGLIQDGHVGDEQKTVSCLQVVSALVDPIDSFSADDAVEYEMIYHCLGRIMSLDGFVISAV